MPAKRKRPPIRPFTQSYSRPYRYRWGNPGRFVLGKGWVLADGFSSVLEARSQSGHDFYPPKCLKALRKLEVPLPEGREVDEPCL